MSRTPEITHKIMSSIKSRDTKPEITLRKSLWHKGLRFRVNYTKLPGKPDIVFTRAKIAVFCDGDFWHGHNWAIRGLPSLDDELAKYSDFWRNKILGNIKRDKETNLNLKNMGWIVMRFWESEIRTNPDNCCNKIEQQYRLIIQRYHSSLY